MEKAEKVLFVWKYDDGDEDTLHVGRDHCRNPQG